MKESGYPMSIGFIVIICLLVGLVAGALAYPLSLGFGTVRAYVRRKIAAPAQQEGV